MHTISDTDEQKLTDSFWTVFLAALSSLESRDEIFLGLSGGSSFDIFYAHIREYFREIPEKIREKIRFVFLDERVVPVDHGDSNEGQLRKKFLSALVGEGSIAGEQIISAFPSLRGVEGNETTKQSSVPENYSEYGLLPASQGRKQLALHESYSSLVPCIDIALFGVGPDGHIASLFPHHPLLQSTETSYLEITDSPKLPTHRITVSPRMIESMSYVFIAFMRGKEAAYANFRNMEIGFEECPAKLVMHAENHIVFRQRDEREDLNKK